MSKAYDFLKECEVFFVLTVNGDYLDRMYVHKDYQLRGIATAICDKLEQSIKTNKIITHSSITAKHFFAKRGFRVVKEQQVIRNGIALTNYVMEKQVR